MPNTVSFITAHFDKHNPDDLASCLAIGGFGGLKRALGLTPAELIQIITASGIQGRGGAAYSTGIKWRQAADVPGDDKVVICNADEGEPCTFKDRTLMEKDPFRLLEGMAIAGYAVGAKHGYIYLREEYRHLRPKLQKAIDQARTNQWLGSHIQGTNFSFDITLYSGAGAYVCGEGSTLIESMEGKSGRPRIKPPFIKECGLFQKPTLVNNVETLSAAAAILDFGAEEFKAYGTEKSPGTKLISLAGNVRRPGAYEIPFGMTLRAIIETIGGGLEEGRILRLVQLGGASGRIAPASLLDTPYTYEDLAKAGLDVGSGGILVVDDRTSVIEFLESIQDFFIHESCGKCTPCREGNRQIGRIIARFADGAPRPDDLETAKRFATIMSNCSFCGLGETAQSALLSAIRHFPEVFELGAFGEGDEAGLKANANVKASAAGVAVGETIGKHSFKGERGERA
ncbi:complex I 51 kDa subunit family protein [Acidaminobacter sp.]|uniref:complex I 51 kDa subunit family protein n=1 Tax=Acidaminobacter sp. TaxID=1872102 RepID=UPI00256CAF2F|nr:NADH-ubiquinone oxidoreductase-F iron-sulfur binding region domain-containing protein [Acidaminobacter sp.]MDK9711533.1 SLBB domain-containing protein [Acidaminobacter sp.]